MTSAAATEGLGVMHRVLSHRPRHFFSVQALLWVDTRCPCFQGTPTGRPPSRFPSEGGTHDTAQLEPRAAVLWPCFQDLLQFSVHARIADRQLMTQEGGWAADLLGPGGCGEKDGPSWGSGGVGRKRGPKGQWGSDLPSLLLFKNHRCISRSSFVGVTPCVSQPGIRVGLAGRVHLGPHARETWALADTLGDCADPSEVEQRWKGTQVGSGWGSQHPPQCWVTCFSLFFKPRTWLQEHMSRPSPRSPSLTGLLSQVLCGDIPDSWGSTQAAHPSPWTLPPLLAVGQPSSREEITHSILNNDQAAWAHPFVRKTRGVLWKWVIALSSWRNHKYLSAKPWLSASLCPERAACVTHWWAFILSPRDQPTDSISNIVFTKVCSMQRKGDVRVSGSSPRGIMWQKVKPSNPQHHCTWRSRSLTPVFS